MADEKPKPQAKRKKRRLAPLRDEHVRYLVAIGAWDWSYSFGLDDRKDSMDPCGGAAAEGSRCGSSGSTDPV